MSEQFHIAAQRHHLGAEFAVDHLDPLLGAAISVVTQFGDPLVDRTNLLVEFLGDLLGRLGESLDDLFEQLLDRVARIVGGGGWHRSLLTMGESTVGTARCAPHGPKVANMVLTGAG